MTVAMFNEDLIRDLARQRVVLFLGAGVSSSAEIGGDHAFKGWPDFLSSAALSRPEPLKTQVNKLICARDYLLACELLQVDYGDAWGDIVTEEYGRAATPSHLHEKLISLGQRIIITTNFDKLIESAWTASIKPGDRYFKTITRVDSSIFKILKDHDTPYVIKIHGSIDDTSSLVFSRSEYIRHAFGNENYSLFIDSLLLNYTFLYVGFSMDDPAILSLMELYALRYPGARPHYIVSGDDVPENIREIHKKLRKLIAIPYSKAGNHAELPLVIERLSLAVKDKRREFVANELSASLSEVGNLV